MAKFSRTRGDMSFSQAVDILRLAIRHELRDPSFGDVEVDWRIEGIGTVATGYFGHSSREITIYAQRNVLGSDVQESNFTEETAYALRKYCSKAEYSRNE